MAVGASEDESVALACELDAEADDWVPPDSADTAAESVGRAAEDEKCGPERPAVGESVSLVDDEAEGEGAHDDDALLDAAVDDGCAEVETDVEEGCAEVGALLGALGEVGVADRVGWWVGCPPSGGPGSTGGTVGVRVGGVGAAGPTGTMSPTPAAYVRSSPSTSTR